MNKAIKVKVGTKQQAAKEFIRAWHQLKSPKGKDYSIPDEHIYFENAALLLKTLTPKRLELLRAVRHSKKTSIRALAKLLERDYKNVHQDVHTLEQIGLLVKTGDSKITMPWETIITEIPMNNDFSGRTSREQYNTPKKRAIG